MSHFGIICPTASGHLNSIIPLGCELKRRGHRVTLIALMDAQAKAAAAGIDFQPIGVANFPKGATAVAMERLGELEGRAALRYTIELYRQRTELQFQEVPSVIQNVGIDSLLVDQTSFSGSSIAEKLGLPFITICSALVLNRDPTVPPFNFSWRYQPTGWAKIRNQLGYRLIDRITKPIQDVIFSYRRQWNLSGFTYPNDLYSPLAQISQQPAAFEYPRSQLPANLHFTGPYHSTNSRESVEFPWDQLTGQPLIYASMGTIQNRLLGIFEAIATACADMDSQLVISLGGSNDPTALPSLPGNPVVVKFAPQLELLQKAALTITHAGLNTTLESLSNGVPLVAIPIANDQPGVGARIQWTGTGECIPLKKVTSDRLRPLIRQVLTDERYRHQAQRLQQAIQQAGGVSRAADIVEQAIASGQPILSQP